MTQRMIKVTYFFTFLTTQQLVTSGVFRDHVKFPSVVDKSSCGNGYENIQRNSIDPKVFI